MIGPQAFYTQHIAPTLMQSFVPRRFEEQCRVFFSLLAQTGQLEGVTDIGTYYYDDPVHRRNGEFDIALAFGDAYELYEAKYCREPVTLEEIHREIGQVQQLDALRQPDALKVVRLGFIAVNGFAGMEPGYSYYTGEDLYA